MKGDYEIFISFKKTDNGELTRDAYIAKAIYDFLHQNGFEKVFYSDVEVSKAGRSNYAEIIDEALNSASILIFVATKVDYLNTPYVSYEWTSFANEIKTGCKEGEIYGFVEGVNIHDLPYTLRIRETFSFDEDGLRRLLVHLSNNKRLTLNTKKQNIYDLINENNSLIFKECQSLKENFYERESVNNFIDLSFNRLNPLSILFYEDNCGSSAILYNKAVNISNTNKALGYFKGMGEFQTFYNNYIEQIHEIDLSYFIIDKISNSEQMNNLIDIMLSNKNICVLTSISKHNSGLLVNIPLELNYVVYNLELPSEEETQRYIRQISKELDLPLLGNLESVLMLPNARNLRNPGMLKLILSSIKNLRTYLDSDYNITDVFDVIEDYLSNKNERLIEAIDYLFELLLRKKINQFTLSEIKDYEKEISLLCDLSLISKNRFGYTITNQEYLIYRVALTMLMKNGIDVNPENFSGLEESIPYFIYLCYLNAQILKLNLCQELDTDNIIKLLSFLLSEKKVFKEIVNNRQFDNEILTMLYQFRKSGLYSLASIIIECFEECNIPSVENFDYLSEKIMIHYYTTGLMLEVDNDYGNVPYRKAYIYFCMDDHNNSLKYFDMAFKKMMQGDKVDVNLIFDYIEVLLDVGDQDKINYLLDIIKQNVDQNDIEYYLQFNLIKGMSCIDNLELNLANTYLNNALNCAFKQFNLRIIQRINGELGLLNYYSGNFTEAKKYLYRNMEIAKSLEDYNGITISSKLLGMVFLLEGDNISAYRYLSYSEIYAKKATNLWRLYKIQLYLTLYNKNSIERIREIEENSRIISLDLFQAEISILLSMNYLAYGKEYYDKAIKYAERATELSTKCKSTRNNVVAEYLLSRIKNEKICLSVIDKYLTSFSIFIERIMNQQLVVDANYFPLPLHKYKELETDRLYLIILSSKYAKDIYEYSKERLTTQYVLWKRHNYIQDTLKYIQSTNDLKTIGYGMTWGILLKTEDKVIGTIDLNYSSDYDGVEIGFILNDKYWHYGYATEAIKAVIDFVKNNIPLKELIGVCITENELSKRTLLRNGFKFSNKIENYHRLSHINDKSGEMYVLDLK